MLKSHLVRISGIALALTLFGCASASVNQTYKTLGPLPKPDLIVVQTFAVTSAEVQLDRGLVAGAIRSSSDDTQTSEEVQVGHIVANKLADKLVEDLQMEGIPAVRQTPDVQITPTTAIIAGEFTTVDQGNQSARVWVGFGMGGSKLQTRVHVFQGGQMVAEGETSTNASLKPGMFASAGAAVATGGAAPVVIGAAGTVYTEAFTQGVNADASRTATQIAQKIKQGYIDRGWL